MRSYDDFSRSAKERYPFLYVILVTLPRLLDTDTALRLGATGDDR